jgi:uncharacterized repeat protein (TIGR04076 family)
MESYYPVKVEVIHQQGICHQGQKVGDSWIVNGKTPEGICVSAFAAMCGKISYLEYDAKAPWHKERKNESVCACPDPDNPVVFKLTRLTE